MANKGTFEFPLFDHQFFYEMRKIKAKKLFQVTKKLLFSFMRAYNLKKTTAKVSEPHCSTFEAIK